MQKIIILDFGSQYTQMVARKVRELGVYAEIFPYSISESELKSLQPKGIILSGGPSSVHADGAPIPSFDVFSIGVPILGICYGLQLIAHQFGGTVSSSERREYGRSELILNKEDALFDSVPVN